VVSLLVMLPTTSAPLAVERLEARGLVGAARSSPQPPLAVARRARLEVVVPTRQHWTKRLMSSVCVLTDCGACSTAGSIVLFAVHRLAATSRQEFGAAMSRTQSAICGCRRDDAVASARPGRDSSPPWSAADLVFSHADHRAAACSNRNSILWRHIVWSTTASFRATATSDFRAPIRSDKAWPQMESWEGRIERRSMTLAAS
jgi:hypothetical protein